MVGPSNGINAYSTTDQISRPSVERLPALPVEQKDARENGSATDRTDISAEALALSKKVQSAGASSEQGETRASERGETREESASTQPPRPSNNHQSSPSIDIRI